MRTLLLAAAGVLALASTAAAQQPLNGQVQYSVTQAPVCTLGQPTPTALTNANGTLSGSTFTYDPAKMFLGLSSNIEFSFTCNTKSTVSATLSHRGMRTANVSTTDAFAQVIPTDVTFRLPSGTGFGINDSQSIGDGFADNLPAGQLDFFAGSPAAARDIPATGSGKFSIEHTATPGFDGLPLAAGTFTQTVSFTIASN